MTRADFILAALAANSTSCIVWPYAIRKNSGYPAHSVKKPRKRNYDAHRYVCELAHGPAPEKTEAAHACGNKLCVNPAHLSWKTHKENMVDAVHAGTIPGGGRARQTIFTEQREYIAACGKSLSVLAQEFNTSPSYVGRLKRSVLNV